MKKLFIIAISSLAANFSFGQYNRPFATNGDNRVPTHYIGIGTKPTTNSTALPSFNLHLHGSSDYLLADRNGILAPVNYGKTTRMGFTNTTTGVLETDGTVLRMSDNNFSIENRENGNLSIEVPNVSMIFSNSSSRIWVRSVSNINSADYAHMNIIAPSSDNGLFIQSSGTKYALGLKTSINTTEALIVRDAANLNNFSVKGNGEVNSGNLSIASPASTNAISVSTAGSSNINFQVSSEGVVNTKDLFVNGTFRVTNSSNDNQFSINNLGFVRARDILVDFNPIPDYVFGNDYKLISLSELEDFIIKNKHLPNIKSEKEFDKEEGLSLGEMNLKLLEKVEELTLYVIDLQKQINELKSNK